MSLHFCNGRTESAAKRSAERFGGFHYTLSTRTGSVTELYRLHDTEWFNSRNPACVVTVFCWGRYLDPKV